VFQRKRAFYFFSGTLRATNKKKQMKTCLAVKVAGYPAETASFTMPDF